MPPDKMSQQFRTRPCDDCRRRKSKCVRILDDSTCLACKGRSQKCTFVEEPRRRKIRKMSETEVSQKSLGVISAPESRNEPIDVQDTTPEDYASLKGPSLLKKTLGLQNSRCSFLLGPTGFLDNIFVRGARFNAREEAESELPPGLRLRRATDDVIFLMREDPSIDGFWNIRRECDAIEDVVAPYGKDLIDLFFRIVHPSYPILHKKVVLEKYARSYQEFTPPLLAAIYSVALNWWSYASHLPQDGKPEAQTLNNLGLRSFNEAMRYPKLSTVQAGLLLLQALPGRDDVQVSLVSQIVGMSHQLGLHLDCREWKIPRWERKLRRRLAWAVWTQDKWHTLATSFPSHISRDNWMVTQLCEEDFPEKPGDEPNVEGSSDIESGQKTFQYMVYLSYIVDDIMRLFYCARASSSEMSTSDILESAKPVQTKLKQWLQSLPECCRMSNLKSGKFTSSAYLYLSYLAAEISLHRKILKSLNGSSSPELTLICRNAASERLQAALDFVRDLRLEQVQAFWHSSASFNFALIGTFAGLLWATSTDEDERQFFESCLKNYRWAIRVSSVASTQMAEALRKLDTMVCYLPFMSEGVVSNLEFHPTDSEYSDEGQSQAFDDVEESFLARLEGAGLETLRSPSFWYHDER